MPRKITDWKKAGQHDVTLASGFEVAMRIPNLPELVQSGEFPNHLVETAIKLANADPADPENKITADDIKEQAEFYRALVSKSLVDPEVTPEEVKDLPFEDVELIVSIATRQRDLDAVGNHISGLEKSEQWRRFRKVQDIYEDLEDV